MNHGDISTIVPSMPMDIMLGHHQLHPVHCSAQFPVLTTCRRLGHAALEPSAIWKCEQLYRREEGGEVIVFSTPADDSSLKVWENVEKSWPWVCWYWYLWRHLKTIFCLTKQLCSFLIVLASRKIGGRDLVDLTRICFFGVCSRCQSVSYLLISVRCRFAYVCCTIP